MKVLLRIRDTFLNDNSSFDLMFRAYNLFFFSSFRRRHTKKFLEKIIFQKLSFRRIFCQIYFVTFSTKIFSKLPSLYKKM
jgi:hypothetical protein